jgi:hypothetical protein
VIDERQAQQIKELMMGYNYLYDFTPIMRPGQYDRDCIELGVRVANEFEYILLFGDEQTQVRINQADKNGKRYLADGIDVTKPLF